MTAVDTSVVVAALIQWHQHHETALEAAANSVIPGHAYIESYSVMTRMPGGVAADVAEDALARRFSSDRVLGMGSLTYESVVRRARELKIDGGSTYDALIAVVAQEHGHALATRDRRAVRTYEAVGVDVEWVGE